ncbi:hypothetical protein BGZ60DRAFT_435137 [Tricladium varicosporioides]|nr:hypothetical protein BGZ60DRAFT_435137 [Hymenoscyphus varicosporioides]
MSSAIGVANRVLRVLHLLGWLCCENETLPARCKILSPNNKSPRVLKFCALARSLRRCAVHLLVSFVTGKVHHSPLQLLLSCKAQLLSRVQNTNGLPQFAIAMLASEQTWIRTAFATRWKPPPPPSVGAVFRKKDRNSIADR